MAPSLRKDFFLRLPLINHISFELFFFFLRAKVPQIYLFLGGGVDLSGLYHAWSLGVFVWGVGWEINPREFFALWDYTFFLPFFYEKKNFCMLTLLLSNVQFYWNSSNISLFILFMFNFLFNQLICNIYQYHNLALLYIYIFVVWYHYMRLILLYKIDIII